MEVHAHTHTARKKWTHYLWEFLMLFLAVFCGFLAEYQLEHKIEKDREKQFMKSLKEDLAIDTLNIGAEYELGMKQKALRDSAVSMINNNQLTQPNIVTLYELSENSTREVRVFFENRTASQLKNAGGMRLIHKDLVADSILAYWADADYCNSIADRLERYGEYRDNVAVRIFDNKYLAPNNTPFFDGHTARKDAKLIDSSPALLSEYSNRTKWNSDVLNNYLFMLKQTKEKAAKLINQIKKEYHLD